MITLMMTGLLFLLAAAVIVFFILGFIYYDDAIEVLRWLNSKK